MTVLMTKTIRFTIDRISQLLRYQKTHARTLPRVRPASAIASPVWAVGCGVLLGSLSVMISGCGSKAPSIREIQARRSEQQRATANVDHIRDAFRFLSTYAELNADQASKRIAGLLNNWADEQAVGSEWNSPELLNTVPSNLAGLTYLQDLESSRFVESDTNYLRLNYLLQQVTQWVDPEISVDPVFADWLDEQLETLGEENTSNLKRAAELFDWTVRNIQLEPLQAQGPGPTIAGLPAGLEFRGPGYRQTTFETLYRSVGDKLQRARVFIQLCRQVGIDACLLATEEGEAWAVGVKIGEQVYLFEPQLGLPVPGPGEIGIATLAQAREDESVMRRLTVVGWFDYPLGTEDVQSNIALLDAPPQSMARRMAQLQNALVGENRLVLGYDIDRSAASFTSVNGIASAKIWELSLQAPIYQMALEEMAKSDQQIAIWLVYKWGMLQGTFPLALARWDHLRGDFDRSDTNEGARVQYMEMRMPDFEIDDLGRNIDLQTTYNVRRQIDQSDEAFNQQIAQVQLYMRLAKQASSYWISLIHYDRGEFENAISWLDKRVLSEREDAIWNSGARYNLARAYERTEQLQEAEALYKTEGDPQEHGNRLRARLLDL